MDCVFCQIVSGEVSADILYKRGGVTAFRDLQPQAPTHILVVPDRHIAGPAFLSEPDDSLVGHVVRVAAEIARQEGIEESGYRLIINQGHDAGQTIDHMHLHLLGGRPLKLPLA